MFFSGFSFSLNQLFKLKDNSTLIFSFFIPQCFKRVRSYFKNQIGASWKRKKWRKYQSQATREVSEESRRPWEAGLHVAIQAHRKGFTFHLGQRPGTCRSLRKSRVTGAVCCAVAFPSVKFLLWRESADSDVSRSRADNRWWTKQTEQRLQASNWLRPWRDLGQCCWVFRGLREF